VIAESCSNPKIKLKHSVGVTVKSGTFWNSICCKLHLAHLLLAVTLFLSEVPYVLACIKLCICVAIEIR